MSPPLRRSLRLPQPRVIFEPTISRRTKVSQPPPQKPLPQQQPSVPTARTVVNTKKIFTKRRQAFVTEFKNRVAFNPTRYPFKSFKDQRFVIALCNHLRTKIEDLTNDNVRAWVQRHPWIIDETHFEATNERPSGSTRAGPIDPRPVRGQPTPQLTVCDTATSPIDFSRMSTRSNLGTSNSALPPATAKTKGPAILALASAAPKITVGGTGQTGDAPTDPAAGRTSTSAKSDSDSDSERPNLLEDFLDWETEFNTGQGTGQNTSGDDDDDIPPPHLELQVPQKLTQIPEFTALDNSSAALNDGHPIHAYPTVPARDLDEPVPNDLPFPTGGSGPGQAVENVYLPRSLRAQQTSSQAGHVGPSRHGFLPFSGHRDSTFVATGSLDEPASTDRTAPTDDPAGVQAVANSYLPQSLPDQQTPCQSGQVDPARHGLFPPSCQFGHRDTTTVVTGNLHEPVLNDLTVPTIHPGQAAGDGDLRQPFSKQPPSRRGGKGSPVRHCFPLPSSHLGHNGFVGIGQQGTNIPLYSPVFANLLRSSGYGLQNRGGLPTYADIWAKAFMAGNQLETLGTLVEVNSLATLAVCRSANLSALVGRSAKNLVTRTELEMKRLLAPSRLFDVKTEDADSSGNSITIDDTISIADSCAL